MSQERETSEEKELNEKLAKHREKNFKVEIRPATRPSPEGELFLAVTTNGTQWQTMSLLIGEANKVMSALDDYIKAIKE